MDASRFQFSLRCSSQLALAAALMLACSGVAFAQSQPGRPASERSIREQRETFQRQQLEAMGRLSASQRQRYFAELRDLQLRFFNERQNRTAEAERCVVPARDRSALEGCQRTQDKLAKQQRRQQITDMTELRRRFGLPIRPQASRSGQPAQQA